MAIRGLFPVLLGVLLAFSSHSQVSAWDYSCKLDNSSSYEPPPPCYGSSSNAAAPPPESYGLQDGHRQQHRHLLEESTQGNAEAGGSPVPHPHPPKPDKCEPNHPSRELLKCCLRFEYVFSEYCSRSVYGHGLDHLDSNISTGKVQGGHQVFISHPTYEIADSIARLSVDNIKAHLETLGYNLTGPDINIQKDTFADVVDGAFGFPLWPRFDPYKSENNFLIGSYWFVGLLTKCYGGIIDRMDGPRGKRFAGSLLAAKAQQEVAIRTVLYQRLNEQVDPYHISILDATTKISQYRDQLLNTSGTSDEGFHVPSCIGDGGQGKNLFSVDNYGLPYIMTVEHTCNVSTRVLKGFLP